MKLEEFSEVLRGDRELCQVAMGEFGHSARLQERRDGK